MRWALRFVLEYHKFSCLDSTRWAGCLFEDKSFLAEDKILHQRPEVGAQGSMETSNPHRHGWVAASGVSTERKLGDYGSVGIRRNEQ